MSLSFHLPGSISISSHNAQKSLESQSINDELSFRNINELFLFPFYDEMLRVIKLNSLFSIFLIIIMLVQVSKSFPHVLNNIIFNFFSDFNFSSAYEAISFPIFYFVFNIFFFIFLFLNYRAKRIFSYWQLFLASLILNFFNPIFFVPACGVCGYSTIQLERVVLFHNQIRFNSTEQYIQEQMNYTNNFHNYGRKHLFSSNISYNNLSTYFYKNNMSFKSDNAIINKNYEFQSSNNNNNFHFINTVNDDQRKFTLKKRKKRSFADEYTKQNLPSPTYKENDGINLFLDSNFSKYVFSLIISFALAILIFTEVIINFHFVSESPYLNRTLISMWDPKVFTLSLFCLGITQFSYIFLSILPSWCTVFYQIISLVFIAYIIYYTFFQPFIFICVNSYIQSLLTSSFFGTFFVIVYTLKPSRVVLSLINGSIFFFFIFFILFYFINKKIISTINSKLSPSNNLINHINDSNDDRSLKKKLLNDQNHELNDIEKRELFDSYVFQSIEHALLYLRVGISCASPYFVDFSFIRYMKECYGQNEIQFFILQLTALFPSQHQFLSFCMSNMSKKEDFFNIFEMFFIYQLRRINTIRQSSVSRDVQNEFIFLEKKSDECISTIRGFWSELLQSKTDFTPTSLGYIRRMTLNTRSCYIDAIEKFPNSQQILNSYARFLCESCGDYIECTRIGQKMRMIEKGKNVNVDLCFHSFVNVFPHYLKKSILDMKGCFIANTESFISQQSSSSLSDDKLSASLDNSRRMYLNGQINYNNCNNNYSMTNRKKYREEFEQLIDKEHFDTLINSLYDYGKQRISIQQIVYKSHNKELTMSRIISIVQIAVTILLTFLSFFYFDKVGNPVQIMESSTRVSNIISSIQYCSLIAGVRYLSEQYQANISSSIIRNLNIRYENLPDFPCTFISPMTALDQKKKSISDFLDAEMKFLLNNPENHQNEIKIYTEMNSNNQSIDNYNENSTIGHENGVFIYKFVNKNPHIYKIALRNGIEYFQICAERLAYEHFMLENSDSNQKNFSSFYDTYFELLMNGLTLSEPFYHLFQAISDNGVYASNSIKHFLIVISEVVLVICFLFFSIARIYNFIKIKKGLKYSSMVLRKIKNEDISESFKPIYLKSKKPIKIHSTNKHSIHDHSPSLILLQIVSICSLICFIGFSSGFIIQFSGAFSFINKAFQWAKNGASRFLSLSRMMNALISRKIGIVDFNIANGMNQEVIELLQLSHNLDLSIIGKGKELDQFYFMINDHIYLSDLFSSESKNDNETSKKSKHPFHLNTRKRKKMSSHFNYSINLLNHDSANQMIYTTTKCVDYYDNTNVSTQMNLATYLDCISIENKINLGIHFYFLMENSIDKSPNLIESPEFITILFIIDKYLYSDLPKFQQQISHIAQSEINNQMSNVRVIGFIGIAVAFALFLLENLLIHFIYLSYDAFRQLILVLPPSAFTNNPCLVNYFTSMISNIKVNSKMLKSSVINPLSSMVQLRDKVYSNEDILINSMDHSAISTCKDLIIQCVNPAVQKMTGFPSDQLLGQGLTYLIPLKSKEDKSSILDKVPFYQRLEEIQSNSGDRFAEVNAKCLNDKGEELQVQATIIGIFDQKRNVNKTGKNDLKINKSNNNVYDEIDDNDNNNSNESENDEEFVGATIILKDISVEVKQEKIMKETKKKTEALLNLLLPQPVLEEIRSFRKPIFKNVETATLIKMELTGLDEYVSSLMPKHMMYFLQILYNEIRKINNKKEILLFTKPESERRPNNRMLIPKTSSYDFNFDISAITELDDGFPFKKENFDENFLNDQKNDCDDEYEYDINDNDEICDFGCIYNIRNDNDNFVSIAGLFDTQDELQKQAESCVRYALKVKEIVDKIGLEDRIGVFISARIAVCMGGPVAGFVENPENPNVEIFSDLLKESDIIKDNGEVGSVYINENVYKYLNKKNYEIEEKCIKYRKPITCFSSVTTENDVKNENNSDIEINIYNETEYEEEEEEEIDVNDNYNSSNGSNINIENDIFVGSKSSIDDIYNIQKVYVVNKCLRKKKKSNLEEKNISEKNIFLLPADSTE